MKKKLEAELISIAHRILKLKNKSDINQLHLETQQLLEKLSVLRFVEEHFSDVKPTIGSHEVEAEVERIFETAAEKSDEQDVLEPEPELVSEPIEIEQSSETEVEDKLSEVADEPADTEEKETASEDEPEMKVSEEESVSFKPAFELSFDASEDEEKEKEETTQKSSVQITFDDLLGADYIDPVFVKPEELIKKEEIPNPADVIPISRSYNDAAPVIPMNKEVAAGSISLNDRMAKGIIIGLNDRIAFMNHLFANSSEDYNRVLSQLMTFDTYQEAKNFIDNMVKPDYNNWEGKEEYADRFMEIVEKRFS